MAHLAFPHKFRHSAHRLFDRSLWIHAVLIVKIDRFHAEPAQARLARGAHILRRAADAALGGFIRIAHKAKLRRQHHLLAMARQRLAHKFLVREGTIHIRGVNERHPEFDCTVNGRDGLHIVTGSIEVRHAHAAEAERRDVETAFSQFMCFHTCNQIVRAWSNAPPMHSATQDR